MLKSTPGPWLHRGKSDSVHRPSETHPYGETIFRFDDEESPFDADLALILAAPDMLEVLIEVDRENSAALAGMKDDDIQPPNWFVDQCQKVKDAITKATGATP